MMTEIHVPPDHPFTPSHAGMTVFAVLGADYEIGGVYPTVERAFAYACDWIKAGNPNAVVTMEPISGGADHVANVFVDGKPDYIIEKTYFRL